MYLYFFRVELVSICLLIWLIEIRGYCEVLDYGFWNFIFWIGGLDFLFSFMILDKIFNIFIFGLFFYKMWIVVVIFLWSYCEYELDSVKYVVWYLVSF